MGDLSAHHADYVAHFFVGCFDCLFCSSIPIPSLAGHRRRDEIEEGKKEEKRRKRRKKRRSTHSNRSLSRSHLGDLSPFFSFFRSTKCFVVHFFSTVSSFSPFNLGSIYLIRSIKHRQQRAIPLCRVVCVSPSVLSCAFSWVSLGWALLLLLLLPPPASN